MKKIFVFIVALLLLAVTSHAQNLENIGKEKPLSLSGGVYAGVNYLEGLRNAGNSPLGYNMGLNLNLSFYNNFNLPLSFYYSNYGSGFNTLTFRQFGISPSYKFARVHLGYRSYPLSPYVFSGMTTLGAGLELNFQKFNFLAFTGKVVDPYNLGDQYLAFADPELEFYKRNVYGFRIGVGRPANSFNIQVFHAKDNPESGSVDSLLNHHIYPMENLVIGAELNQLFFKIITLHVNAAASLVTHNINGDLFEMNEKEQAWLDRLSFLATFNTTSRFAFAYDSRLSVRIKTLNVGVKYQHVDPLYSSLGTSFMQTNFDNYLLDLNGSLFKSKLSLFGNAGLQFVNKDGFTGNAQKRTVASLTTNWNISKQLGAQFSINNMAQNSMPLLREVADTLKLVTNTMGWNAGIQFKPGTGKVQPHSISASISQNTFDLIQSESQLMKSSNFYTNAAYRYVLKNKWNAGLGLDYSTFDMGDNSDTQRIGATASYGVVLLKNINLKTQFGYRINRVNGDADGNIINSGIQAQWKHPKNHSVSFSLNHMMRNTQILPARNDLRVRLNYAYSFSTSK